MILRRILERLQIDRTLSYALAMRVWQAVSGPLTIWLVMDCLNKDETGVFYALVGVLNVQAMFELGLLNVLIAHSGHAASGIEESRHRSPDGHPSLASLGRMQELIRASRIWFAGASILFAVFAFGLGWYTFTNSGTQAEWYGPLLAVVPIAALTVFISPTLAILEGSGQRELIYRFSFYTRFAGSFAVWATLFFGFGIWALVISALVQLLWSAYLPLVHQRSFFEQFKSSNYKSKTAETVTGEPTVLQPMDTPHSGDGAEFSWMKDVVPAQWRIAMISIAYQLAVQYFTLILVNFHGTVEAGRLGMTLTITGAIQMLALAWVQTKFSLVSAQHGAGNREGAGTMWRQTALVSTTLLVTAFLTLWGILYCLPHIESMIVSAGFRRRDIVGRFISPSQCAILAVACVANHLIALQSFYVIARKANPLVVASVVGSLFIAATVWISGAKFATDGIVIGYAMSVTFIALPLHTIAYLRFRSNPEQLAPRIT